MWKLIAMLAKPILKAIESLLHLKVCEFMLYYCLLWRWGMNLTKQFIAMAYNVLNYSRSDATIQLHILLKSHSIIVGMSYRNCSWHKWVLWRRLWIKFTKRTQWRCIDKFVCEQNSHIRRNCEESVGCFLPSPYLSTLHSTCPFFRNASNVDITKIRRKEIVPRV